MPVLLFLNELSCAAEASRTGVDQAMVKLVELLRTIRWRRGDIVLVTHVPLKSIELAQDYYMQQWIAADPANRDRWRFILAIQNRAPFRSVSPENAHSDVEYRYGNRRADGLGAAHLLDGLAVSLSLDTAWEHAWVDVDRWILGEDDSGDLVVQEERVEVRHAATCNHATVHKSWVQQAGQDVLTSGAAIWESKGSFFPHLTFLPRVEYDLRNLQPDCLRAVVNQLFKLEQAVAEWPHGHVAPQWKTKVTGEYPVREQLCEFTDIDGMVRVFELHARFTPGPGRLHFRLVPEDRTVRIAYIGRKRGI